MKRILFLMLFGMTLLWGGCCRNVPQKGNELKPGRLVEQVVVRCGSKADCGEERITDPEKIRQILDLLRQLKLQGTTDTVPAVDPEQIRIELRFSDGSRRSYVQSLDRFLQLADGTWNRIDPEQGRELRRALLPEE